MKLFAETSFVVVIFLSFLTSCLHSSENIESVRVVRLDSALRYGTLPDSRTLRSATEVLFKVSGYGSPTESSVVAYSEAPFITMSAARMDSVWGRGGDESAAMMALEKGLGRMSVALVKEIPDVKMPAVYSIVSPFNQSVITYDSLLFVGLNHYLGTSFAPYAYFPDYIRRRKVEERVLPDVAEAIIRRDFPYRPSEEYPTVASRLLYEGAVVEAVKRLTGLDAYRVLGYDESEWKWLEDNEQNIWHALAARKLLFSTDALTVDKLVGLSPATTVLNSECPGYAGRFTGYRIVESYLRNNDNISLKQLLSSDFYSDRQTLSKANY